MNLVVSVLSAVDKLTDTIFGKMQQKNSEKK